MQALSYGVQKEFRVSQSEALHHVIYGIGPLIKKSNFWVSLMWLMNAINTLSDCLIMSIWKLLTYIQYYIH